MRRSWRPRRKLRGLEFRLKKKLSARDTTRRNRRGSAKKKRNESRESRKRKRLLRGRRSKISSNGTRPTNNRHNTLENSMRILSILTI
jgi:hypothetical protein